MTRHIPVTYSEPGWDTVRADEVRAGDVWLPNSDERVAVVAVEIIGDGGLPGQPTTVRISGRITKGWGRGRTVRSWTMLASTGCEIIRG